ncbi:hypothetical protein GCM10009504_36200 [Pseudomonas laurentiana]|uniref:DUF2169 family type VI secretion system accessory protein n=1 Tax=Pseudomonas laurentiana TaxID=2364649 RepID=UPI0016799BBA|nr:DUF2169 domain-containing protein [Pseudomonas laurentiana]GGU75760.1 hypothetical protein GCM10009504_36200 [Pseudomonas laurentiana]
MEFRNLTPFHALCFSALDLHDVEHSIIAMKVAYRLRPMTQAPGTFNAEVMDSDPISLTYADDYYGEEGQSSVRAESDLVPFKPRCDVLVMGHAHAPFGQPTACWEAGVRLSIPARPVVHAPLPPGECLTEQQLRDGQAAREHAARQHRDAPTRQVLLEKHLRFTGPRHFRRGLLGWQLSEPEPALRVPLRWEHAFGGSSVVKNPEHAHDQTAPAYLLNEVCFSNPLGCGWIEKRHEQLAWQLDTSLHQLPAPQIEHLSDPIERLSIGDHPSATLDARQIAQVAATYRYTPAGFGIVGRAWAPRLVLAGTYDETWMRERWPSPPKDFDFGYWNAAPADQQIPFAPPDLQIELFNLIAPALSRNGRACIELPGHRPFVLLRLRSGALLPLPLLTDTLCIDTDALTVSLTHRISLPLTDTIRVAEVRFEVNPKAPLIKPTTEVI